MDYKKYSLEKLQEWVHDSLSCGEASPHEIYSVIREAAQEDYQYYKEHSARALGLLELLSGHRPVQVSEEFANTLKNEGYAYTPLTKKDKVTKWVLPVQQSTVDNVEDYYIQFPDDLLEAANLKEGDQVKWIDQGDGSYLLKKVEEQMSYDEAIAAGYTMTDDGFWIKENNGTI